MCGALEQDVEYLGAVPCSATHPCKKVVLSLMAFISLPIIYLSYILINDFFLQPPANPKL